ncbi:MAG: hypothetical protein P8Y70_17975 [Candidatus Lokiarchaeota archaeon]
MRPSRIFRWIVRIFILFLTTTMSAVTIVGGISAVNILKNPGNIAIPSGTVYGSLNISNPSGMYLEIPYNITNAGYYDLTDLSFRLKIYMIYNVTRIKTMIFDETIPFPDVIHGQTLSDTYNATAFIVSNIPDPSKIDFGENIDFTGDFTFRATYCLGLLSFVVNIYNQSLSFP